MCLALEVAQSNLDLTETMMRDHDDAMDCRNLEDLLRLQIYIFSSLKRADQGQREKIYAGNRAYDPKESETLDEAYLRLHKIFRTMDSWVENTRKKGFNIDHLDEYHECRDELADVVDNRSWLDIAAKSRSSFDEDK